MVSATYDQVILLGVTRDRAFSEQLRPELRAQLDSLRDRLLSLFTPLTRMTSRASLEDAIAASTLPWTRIALETLRLVAAVQNPPELLNPLKGAEIETLADRKAGLLGPSYEQFLGALSSFEGLTTWVLEHLQEGGDDAQKVRFIDNLIGTQLLQAQIAIFAIILILDDWTVDWKPESIPILCAIADDRMSEIEDVFDSLIPEVVHDDEVLDFGRG